MELYFMKVCIKFIILKGLNIEKPERIELSYFIICLTTPFFINN